MKVLRFPKVVYVSYDTDTDDKPYLLAWDDLDSAPEGRVASYTLTDEVEKREVTEVRRSGTNTWFKPSKAGK